MFDRRYHFTCLFLVAIAFGRVFADEATQTARNPTAVKILLVTGGCCHDYRFQAEAIQQAMKDAGVAAQWTIVNEGGNGTDAQIDLYSIPKWSDGYDVVIHNECFADTKDTDYIRKITSAHKAGTNAVVIHCAMHTYRNAEIDDWREFLGVTSRRHDHQSHYKIDVIRFEHPILDGFPGDHISAMDELYIIEKTWPATTVLATSKSEKDGSAHPVFWTNQYGKAKVFGTTFGHSNDTFQDKDFLRVLVRGTLWAAGQLEE